MEFLMSLISLCINIPFKLQHTRIGMVYIRNEAGQVQLPILFDSKLHLTKYKSETVITGFYVDISYRAFNLKGIGYIPNFGGNEWKTLPTYLLYCTPPEDLNQEGKPIFKWSDIDYIEYPRKFKEIFVSGKYHGKLIKVKPISNTALIELGLRQEKSYSKEK